MFIFGISKTSNIGRALFPFSFLRTTLTKSISLDRLFLHCLFPIDLRDLCWLYPNTIGDEGFSKAKTAAQCVLFHLEKAITE